MKSYVNLLYSLVNSTKSFSFYRELFLAAISQLKKFQLTHILTPKTSLGNFYLQKQNRLQQILANFTLNPGEIRHSPPQK